ncbi:MAG: efflux transporter periplasmic adaptor subunit [Pedosphaera sp.]|nr:efflux transporter periplasmic adaptor subunit [Pedosphaera sp.]
MVFALFCVFLLLGIVWWVRKHQSGDAAKPGATARAVPPVPVVAGMVVQKDVPIYLDGLGTVQAFNTVTVRPRVDGQLITVGFVEGQDVHVGDVLAQIDPAPFKTALAQNVARQGQDAAQLANAEMDLKRNVELLKDKILSQQVYDTQKALVDQLQAAVRADQAAIDSSQVQLNYTTVASPIDGRTGLRQIDQGNVVHASDPNGLVVITQLRPISVTFTLPEQTLNEIHQHMAAGELTVLAMDRDNRTVLGEGKLAVIDNQIDTTTGTIKLKATFPNEDLRLWPGQFVNPRLLVTTRKGGIVVPASVIQRGPEGSYAFVIKKDSKNPNDPGKAHQSAASNGGSPDTNAPPENLTVEIRPVTVAQIEDGEALIDRGLSPGEQVVVDGQYKLQAGSKVKPSQPGKGGKPAKSEAPGL